MKRLLLILILTCGFQTLTKADDISDFEIEGISVGDNLFEHSAIINKTKKQISNTELSFYPKSKRLALWNIKSTNFKKYESVQFSIDPNNFKIYRISGIIYDLDKNECVSIQKSIIKSLEKDNPTAIKDIEDFNNLDYLDKSGESIANGIYLDFPSGDTFSVECYLYGKIYKEKNNQKDHIKVSIETKENREFIQNEAYE
jgi:hypothetical protein